METLSFDSSALKKFVHPNELGEMQAMVTDADSELRNGTGAGADFRDWLHLPTDYDKDEFARIKAELTLNGLIGCQQIGNLNIQFFSTLVTYKVDLLVSGSADSHFVVPAQQLQIHDVLQNERE